MQINGSALASIRERSGLTQSDLSRLTEPRISQGRISEIESAGTVSVRPATALALAAALRVPVVAITVPPSEQVA